MSFFYKLKKAITNITSKANSNDVDLSEILIEADFGVLLAESIAKKLRKNEDPFIGLKNILESILSSSISKIKINKPISKPHTILMVGTNGSGKTTTIAKIAKILQEQNFSVDIAACDTFRAAATEQLSIWAEKLNCKIFKADGTKDPASVAFEAMQNSQSDILLIDTAGRLQNNVNLMNELSKIQTVLKKLNQNAPNETIITIDSTVGQNSIEQVKEFSKFCNISGVIFTKMDGQAKGGMIVRIVNDFHLPILGIGTGESELDIETFSIDKFLQDLVQ